MDEARREIRELTLRQVAVFIDADGKAAAGDYKGALAVLEGSDLNPDVKARLIKAVQSGSEYAIRRVFQDYEGRLGLALCDSCRR